MDEKHIPFISEQENAEILDLMAQGQQTVQNLQDPTETITLMRYDEESEEWKPRLTNVWPIYVKLANRQALGLVEKNEIRKSGTLRLWIEDFDIDPVHVGDRFTWQNQLCVVELIGAKRFHRIDIDFLFVNEDL